VMAHLSSVILMETCPVLFFGSDTVPPCRAANDVVAAAAERIRQILFASS